MNKKIIKIVVGVVLIILSIPMFRYCYGIDPLGLTSGLEIVFFGFPCLF